MNRNPEIQPRIYGLETEFGHHVNTPDSTDTLRIIENVQTVSGMRATKGNSSNRFLSNGARIYIDFQNHLEYSSPECLTIRDLVMADMAGQELVSRAAQRGRRGRPAVPINTRIVDDKGNTWGSHENYLTRASLKINREYEQDVGYVLGSLAAHLVTRSLLSGAGTLMPAELPEDYVPRNAGQGFLISQKTTDLHKIFGSGSTGRNNKPLILDRDEPWADETKYNRLQVVCGDPTMSPWATAYRFGSTSLVLRMIERGWDLNKYHIKNPIQANETVAYDLSFKETIELDNGREVRPIDIQKALANEALRFVSRHDVPDEERIIAEEWYRALDELSHDYTKLSDRVDWIAKKKLIDLYCEKNNVSILSYGARGIDRLWGELSKNGIAKKLRSQGYFKDPLDTLNNYEVYKFTPPPGRARQRGRAILAFAQAGESVEANWSEVKVPNHDRKVRLLDPFGSDASQRARLQALEQEFNVTILEG